MKQRGKNLHKKGNQRTQATFRDIILSFPAHEANSFSQKEHSSRPPPERGVRVASTTFLSKTCIPYLFVWGKCSSKLFPCRFQAVIWKILDSPPRTSVPQSSDLRRTKLVVTTHCLENYSFEYKHLTGCGVFWFGFKALLVPHFPSLSQRKES